MATECFTYVPLSRGGAVSAEEVESAEMAVEVRVLWGANVLHVAHLAPPRTFYVGESAEAEGECDYSLSAQILGAKRIPLVFAGPGGTRLVIPPGAGGHADTAERGRESFEELKRVGEVRPSRDWPGAHELDLGPGASARVELAGTSLVFQVATVRAGRKLGVGALAAVEPAEVTYAASSFFLHAGVLAIFAFFMPRMGSDADAATDRDNILAMAKLLDASSAREQAEADGARTDAPQLDPAGPRFAAAAGAAGTMGALRAAASGRAAFKGPADTADPQRSRDAMLGEASGFGAVRLLGTLSSSESAAAWAHDSYGGADTSLLGTIFGRGIDDAAGSEGLGPAGPENGGGGRANTIGLNELGELGPGPGGPDQGVGVGRAPRQRTHRVSVPRVGTEVATINGRLPPEAIQRVVRLNFGRFRLCYEAGLRTNPGLQGRVAVKFIIDRAGAVSFATEAGSDLVDGQVSRCVVRAFADLSFPPPEGGMVTVVYPILFSAGDE
jgi:hypothetical protein